MKKALSLLTLMVMLLTALAACGGGAAVECTDEFGCIEVAEGEPIRVAWAFVVSGADESLGTDTKRGVEIAAEEKGQIMGHDI